ncbi:MAG: hypothetical protein KC468_37560 [Myxococcales bacterium]|nr:hypothetical protein [Myxococcales bacterium]
MSRRRRHRALDMLPLLDVFMVILFVFATIQEREAHVSTEEAASLRDELAQARAQLTAAERRGQEDRAARARAEAEAARTESEQLATARRELADAESAERRARMEAKRAREAVDQLRARVTEQLAAVGQSEDVVRRQDVLSKLLHQFTVFEIDITGADSGERVVNHCCYRTDPFVEAWSSCGVVPAESEALREWVRQGGGGLEDVLRRTRGGNAMTIIRQDEVSTFDLRLSLKVLLQERFADHEIYDGGISIDRVRCDGGAAQ